jgi:KDO2-lipid IV(A) lauroyltransferase
MKIPFKSFRYTFGGFFLSLFEFAAPRIPLFLLRLFMDTLFYFLYPLGALVTPFYKHIYDNITTAYGSSLSKREKKKILRDTLKNLFYMPAEILHHSHPKNHHKIIQNFEIAGLEHLREAQAHGRGAIGLGAHIGNFILMVVRFSQSEFPFQVVLKNPKNEMLKKRYDEYKTRCGVRWIDADQKVYATKKILDALRKNHFVYIVSDERKKRGGIIVPFLGTPALTTPGPAVLSLRTGAPILPLFVTRRKGGKHLIEIFPPLTVETTSDQGENIYQITQAANKVIGDFILRHPSQWNWLNPRWKI